MCNINHAHITLLVSFSCVSSEMSQEYAPQKFHGIMIVTTGIACTIVTRKRIIAIAIVNELYFKTGKKRLCACYMRVYHLLLKLRVTHLGGSCISLKGDAHKRVHQAGSVHPRIEATLKYMSSQLERLCKTIALFRFHFHVCIQFYNIELCNNADTQSDPYLHSACNI